MEMNDFEEMRPYCDAEIPAAMERIVSSEFFPLVAGYVYPGQSIERVKEHMRALTTVRDFQLTVMKAVNEQVIARSIDAFTYSGLENVPRGVPCLFVSNHRDIVLDACLMQYILYLNGFPTTEITFGANLMSSSLIVDIGKSNKMFRVERAGSGNPRKFFEESVRLSAYLRHTITQKKESIWIAQRNGRTKDGIDRTNPGIIKMFGMSSRRPKIDALAELNIVPVSVSYEWEPCDILKTIELYQTDNGRYIKKPGEDLTSILTGITEKKGAFHLHFGKRLTAESLAHLEHFALNDFNKEVAALIDREICGNYHLMPSNYIAYDLIYGNNEYAAFYTPAQKDAFMQRMERFADYDNLDAARLTEIFLGIYANPVISHQKLNI